MVRFRSPCSESSSLSPSACRGVYVTSRSGLHDARWYLFHSHFTRQFFYTRQILILSSLSFRTLTNEAARFASISSSTILCTTDMLLRFQSRKGQFRLTTEPDLQFPSLLEQILEKLPPKTDPQSVTLSNRPQGGDARQVSSLKNITLAQVGLKWVVSFC